MRVTPIADSLFALLDQIPYGAYAVSIDQVILHWNRAAKRILGHEPVTVVGRRCYEVTAGDSDDGLAPECLSGCPSIRHLRAGMLPSPIRLHMACASGGRKWVTVVPVVVSGIFWDAPVLVHLFSDRPWDEELASAEDTLRGVAGSGTAVPGLRQPPPRVAGDPPHISPRELEVLQLVALGYETPRIAEHLGISAHTVRNHIRNFRNKLKATTKLEAVMTAVRLGILTVGDEP